MSTAIADAHIRSTALDINRSFCVQAPAGSGKTELLTQRILCLLAHCERPEEILAFTFTRKAAAEMRSRLLLSLQKAAATTSAEIATLPPHTRLTLQLAQAVLARDAEQDWQLLSNSRRLRINTIDSFTGFLTAQLPLSANFGSRPQISTDMTRVFEQTVHDTLAWLDRDAAVGRQVALLLRHLHGDLGKAEQLLLSLLYKRDQWLPLVVALRSDPALARNLLDANLRDMLEDTLQSAQLQLAPLQIQLMQPLCFAAAQLAEQEDDSLQLQGFGAVLPATDAASVSAWRALARFFLVKDLGSFRKKVTVREGFPASSNAGAAELKRLYTDMKEQFAEATATLDAAGLLPLLQLLAKLPDATYSDNQWEILAALTGILPLLAAQLDVAMRQAGQVDHTQTSLAALAALGSDSEPTDLALRLDYRIQHLLVDEFQDTSSMQFHLLEKLTAGWQQGDGRSLFIVGDGMQSCYAFRNANVGLFLRARDQGVGPVQLESLQLTVNFRSDKSVVDWVNRVFSDAFPACDDIARGGVRYSHSQSRAEEAHTAGIACQFWLDDSEETADTETRRAIEAAAVATLCQQLQAEDPAQSIAILVRTRSHLNSIVPALRRLGLRWNASEIDQLLSYPAINDLFTLLRALLNLADTTAWFALLRTPFIGLALADIEQLALHAQARELSLWSALLEHVELDTLSADARARLQRCLPPLQRARELRQILPLRTLLEYLWMDLGGPACLDETSVLQNVSTFLDLLAESTQQDDLADIHHFEKKLQSCYGSASDPSVNLHIMTIHKAKGLEFDTVLLPGLDRGTRSDKNELLLWKEYLDEHNASRPLLAVLHSKGGEEEPLYQYLRYEAELRGNLETTRLLYIAVTRAAKRAWLFGNLKQAKQGITAPAGSLLQTILPVLLAQQETLNVRIDPLPADAAERSSTDAGDARDTLDQFDALDALKAQSTAGLDAQTGTEVPGVTQTAMPGSQSLRRLPANWHSPAAATLPPASAPAAMNLEDTEQQLARKIGELVHLGLKTLVEQGPAWLEHSHTLPFWDRELRPFCGSETEVQQARATVHKHLQQCQQAVEAEWLFHTRHEDAACELELCDYSSGQRCDFIVDRTFIDIDGQRWIIDYKSTTPADGQSLAEFFTEQSVLYRQQLQDYARLLSQRGQPPPRLALFFTGIPALHEVILVEQAA